MGFRSATPDAPWYHEKRHRAAIVPSEDPLPEKGSYPGTPTPTAQDPASGSQPSGLRLRSWHYVYSAFRASQIAGITAKLHRIAAGAGGQAFPGGPAVAEIVQSLSVLPFAHSKSMTVLGAL
jgi:hypothetical protein